MICLLAVASVLVIIFWFFVWASFSSYNYSVTALLISYSSKCIFLAFSFCNWVIFCYSSFSRESFLFSYSFWWFLSSILSLVFSVRAPINCGLTMTLVTLHCSKVIPYLLNFMFNCCIISLAMSDFKSKTWCRKIVLMKFLMFSSTSAAKSSSNLPAPRWYTNWYTCWVLYGILKVKWISIST